MFVLALHYLNGWAMAAADGARKEQAEWPPHPDRVFMALAAAWFETGEDAAEGAALRWLESQQAPAITASDAAMRHSTDGERPVLSYVPTNDTRLGRLPSSNDAGKIKAAGLSLLPEYRSRQPRAFPVAIPRDPIVHFIWPHSQPGEHLTALAQLADKVTHVGHSASFVKAWVHHNETVPTWVPVSSVAEHRLRVPNPGRLSYLAQRQNREIVIAHADLSAHASTVKGKEKKRADALLLERFGNCAPFSLRPEAGHWQGYARPRPPSAAQMTESVFDSQLIVFALTGRRIALPATLKLTEALRSALMAACPEQPPPEWLSGHRPDGRPSLAPHLAFLPLPFVGSKHADGHIVGLGIALPAALDPAEAAHSLGAFLHHPDTGLPRTHTLFDGKWFSSRIEIETRESPPASLRSETWTRSSTVWASVTPVVLDRHFDGKDKARLMVENIKDACERIGLPRPREVLLHPVSLIKGAAHARDFPPLKRKADGGTRYHSHAVLLFDEPVRGPVLIGAGRFRGYGVCRPVNAEGGAND